VLGDGDNVATRNLAHADLTLVASIQVDVVRSHTGSDTELELLGCSDELPREVSRVERSTDVDVCVNDLFSELGVGSFLVRGNDIFVAILLEPVGDTKGILGL
jgi:hypothetical protein